MHNLIFFIAAVFILYRGVNLITALNRKAWPSRVSFLLFALSIGCMVGGGIFVAIGVPFAQYFLLLGIAGFFLFDRRQQNYNRTSLAISQ